MNGMILLYNSVKQSIMNDIILFLSVFVFGYICFMIVVVLMVKLFFPFFTEEELKNRIHLLRLKGKRA